MSAAVEEDTPRTFMWLGENLRPGVRVEVLSEDGLPIGELYLESIIPRFSGAADGASFVLMFDWQRP